MPIHTADVMKLRGHLMHACTLFRNNVLCLWHEVPHCGAAAACDLSQFPSWLNDFGTLKFSVGFCCFICSTENSCFNYALNDCRLMPMLLQ
jgi:hypothetical protein